MQENATQEAFEPHLRFHSKLRSVAISIGDGTKIDGLDINDNLAVGMDFLRVGDKVKNTRVKRNTIISWEQAACFSSLSR